MLSCILPSFLLWIGLAVAQTNLTATVPPVTAAPAAPFVGPAQCLLTLPPFPLTAAGLSTPFQLQGLTAAQPCTMANTQTTTFVEAVIFDPATRHLAVYHPAVVDVGTTPLLPPVVPVIPPTAIVALFFGTNGISLNVQQISLDSSPIVMRRHSMKRSISRYKEVMY